MIACLCLWLRNPASYITSIQMNKITPNKENILQRNTEFSLMAGQNTLQHSSLSLPLSLSLSLMQLQPTIITPSELDF